MSDMEEVISELKDLRYKFSSVKEISTSRKMLALGFLNLVYELLKNPDEKEKHAGLLDVALRFWYDR